MKLKITIGGFTLIDIGRDEDDWTRTTPTEAGYYWMKSADWVCMVYVEPRSDKIFPTALTPRLLSSHADSLWIGPLEIPKKPKS